jgi:pyruvate dehydrogenase E2 component (dihydrolipoamide acetyltransferase)
MDVKLPNLGEGADSGTVVNLLVQVGDSIVRDQPIMELENEKAVASIPSTAEGVVSKIFVAVGDRLSVGQRILSVAGTAGAPVEQASPEKEAPSSTRSRSDSEPAVSGVIQELGDGEGSGLPVAAAPSLRKLASELGIDLRRVRGSERGGRIVLKDVRAYIEGLQHRVFVEKRQTTPTPAAPAAQKSVDFSKWGPVKLQPLTPLRQVISRRMTENWTTIPHVTQYDEADVTALIELRKAHAARYQEKGARLTLTSFAIKALARVLKLHPIFNASLDESGNQIVLKDYIHIGIAVDTEAGLMVPVIRDADRKNLLELSVELEALASKARDRKVSSEDLQGGTFTISNQGGIGGAHFTPIVNKPEVAILGLGRGAIKPVVNGGQIVVKTMLPIAVSYDHRVIDGGTAARFTVDLVKAFEEFAESEVTGI